MSRSRRNFSAEFYNKAGSLCFKTENFSITVNGNDSISQNWTSVQWYNENKDSIFNCFFKFDYENFKNPSKIGLALLYSKVRQANNSTEKYIKIFRENYKDFYPEHPYHRYLTEISRIYENN